MRGNFGTAGILFAIGGFCLWSACSRQNTPQSFAQRLSEADRAVLTNWVAGGAKPNISLNAEETKKLVHALSAAQKVPPTVMATPDFDILFYKGADLLGKIKSAGGGKVFSITNGAYLEKTGILETVFQKAWAQSTGAAP